jgi:hypothetical protein
MIWTQDKRRLRPRHRRRGGAARGRCDEPLRVLVRVLARQAARERFERELAAERETASEVKLH